MGVENQPSKKRAAGRELSRDNPGLDDEEDVEVQELGTFKKASDEVMAARKVVKVRRQQTPTAPSAPSSNPFAGIRLVPPVPAAAPANATTGTHTSEDKTPGENPDSKNESNAEAEVTSKKLEEKTVEDAVESNELKEQAIKENQPDQADKEDADESSKTAEKQTNDSGEKTVETNGSGEKTAETKLTDEKQAEDEKAVKNDKKDDENSDAPLNSFQQLSNSQNAFTGLAGTGFSGSAFSFGSIPKDSSPSQSSLTTFSFGTSNNNGSTPLFGTTGTSLGNKTEGTAFPSMQEAPRETGEENEETVFSADSALFEFFDGGWKERGKGEVKVNVLKDETHKARMVMRAKGNLRLILNASLYSDMKLTRMDKKGITFACINNATEGKDGLSTFALKFKDVSIVEEFSSAISTHKDKPTTGSTTTSLKTPENSPKASDE